MKFQLFFALSDSGTNWGPFVLLFAANALVLCGIYLVASEWYHDSPSGPDMVFEVIKTEGKVSLIKFKAPYSWRDRKYQDQILAKVRYRRVDLGMHKSEIGVISMELNHKRGEVCGFDFVTRMAA